MNLLMTENARKDCPALNSHQAEVLTVISPSPAVPDRGQRRRLSLVATILLIEPIICRCVLAQDAVPAPGGGVSGGTVSWIEWGMTGALVGLVLFVVCRKSQRN